MVYALKPNHLAESLVATHQEGPPATKNGPQHQVQPELAFGRDANVYKVAQQEPDSDFETAVQQALADFNACPPEIPTVRLRGTRTSDPLVRANYRNPFSDSSAELGTVAVMTASITIDGNTLTATGMAYTANSRGFTPLQAEEVTNGGAWSATMHHLSCKFLEQQKNKQQKNK